MLFIFGSTPKITEVGRRQATCPTCGEFAMQRMIKQQQRVSVFFIPVFSFRAKYLVTCAACGVTRHASEAEVFPQDAPR